MQQYVGRNGVVLRPVAEQAKHWDYKAQGLTQGAAAFIMLAVGLATQGLASSLAGSVVSGMKIANTVAGKALEAALTAGMKQLAGRAAVALINNQGDIGAALKELGSDASIKSLATTMLTTGIVAGLDATVLSDSSWGIPSEAEQLATGNFLGKFNTLAPDLARELVRASVRAGVSTAIQGGKFDEALRANLMAAAADVLGAAVAEEIGSAYKHNGFSTNEALNWGLHKVAHAALGCAMGVASSSSGKSCASGALGGMVGEIIAERFRDDLQAMAIAYKAGGMSDVEVMARLMEWRDVGVDMARLAAGLAALAAGMDVDTAAHTGGNAAANNAICGGICIASLVALATWVVSAGNGNPVKGLEEIGAGRDPLSRAVSAGIDKAIELSMEHHPDATRAVLQVLGSVNGAVDAMVTYVDESTGKTVSRWWSSLDPATRNRLKGTTKIIGIFIPATSVRGIRTMKRAASIYRAKHKLGVEKVRVADIVWGNITLQGYPFEHALRTALKLPKSAKLPDNFKTFDYFYNGRAISAKTIDLTAPTYGQPNRVYYGIKNYIDKANQFERYKLSGYSLTAQKITQREVHIGIPKGRATLDQLREMQRAQAYGEQIGVRVRFYEVK